ncbi:MAG: helix-turn-helix domain-containing protein [Minwuia sp.]|uniref:helix-turn-helix domain-containing protein n=1 Tax=Minwuia sp. TaxID=2493630 RepID=UPI003A84787D
MFEAIDGPVRIIVLGEYLMLAALTLSAWPRPRFGPALLAAMICVAGYLWLSGPWPAPSGVLRALLIALSVAVPLALWALSRQVFDDAPGGMPRAAGAALAVPGAAFAAALTAWWEPLFWNGIRLFGLAVLAHAIWHLIADYRGDLVEGRRRARIFVVGVAVLYTAVTLSVELILSDPADRTPLEPLAAISILTVTTLLGMALFAPRRASSPAPAVATVAESAKPAETTDPEAGLLDRLQAHADEGGLFRSGITVASLAGDLGVPEYRLRRAINGGLGFRNFNAFLNSHRIAEARRRLRDPAMTRLPILTIAMDLGYGSVGPFNRAFRDITGETPSAFRQGGNNAET